MPGLLFFEKGIGLEKIARHIEEHGKAYGIDIFPGMRDQAKKRIRKSGLDDHVELHPGDAVTLPCEGN